MPPRPPLKKQDPYELLGISSNPSSKEIKTAYKRKIKICHPDTVKKNNSQLTEKEIKQLISTAAIQFNEIQEAFVRILNEKSTASRKLNHPVHVSDIHVGNDSSSKGLVSDEPKIKVYLPVYVIGAVTDPRSSNTDNIRVTMRELEHDASRFNTLSQKIKACLLHHDHQIGIDQLEASCITDQHSWYADTSIVFVGGVELLLPLANLSPETTEHSGISYFSIKKESKIDIADIIKFFYISNNNIENTDKVTNFIANLKNEGLVNNNPSAQTSLLQFRFDYDQELNTKELISEALHHYRTEYELSSTYDSQYGKMLPQIKELETIHNKVCSFREKRKNLEKLQQLSNGNRFNKILAAMITYYKNLELESVKPLETGLHFSPSTTSSTSTPTITTTTSSTTTVTAPIALTSSTTYPDVKISDLSEDSFFKIPKQSLITHFLTKTISLMNDRSDFNSKAKISKQYKANRLQDILNYVRDLNGDDPSIEAIKALIHSVCALKRRDDGKIPASQKNFESAFPEFKNRIPALNEDIIFNNFKQKENIPDLLVRMQQNKSIAEPCPLPPPYKPSKA